MSGTGDRGAPRDQGPEVAALRARTLAVLAQVQALGVAWEEAGWRITGLGLACAAETLKALLAVGRGER